MGLFTPRFFASVVTASGLYFFTSSSSITGSVLTQSWYPRGTAVAPAPAIVMPTVPKTPGFWERARQSLTQSGRNIRHGVGNAAGWVQQKVTP